MNKVSGIARYEAAAKPFVPGAVDEAQTYLKEDREAQSRFQHVGQLGRPSTG
jgi:hypothetical protein